MRLSVTLHDRILPLPLLQGGMGVGVSLSSLAGAVMKQGGMGVISAAHPGYRKADFWNNSVACNVAAIKEEIAKAKELSGGNGLCGVNIMVASKDYEAYAKAAIEGGADAIISGAGLPMNLPALTKGSDILLAPIVSSARAASLILKSWQRHHDRLPDFLVIEGSEAGGHLGFKKEELTAGSVQTLEEIFKEVRQVCDKLTKDSGKSIPIFVGGGIFDQQDIVHFLSLGASGVQMATRLIATEECDADLRFKQGIVDAKEEDIIFVKSPAGLPGRAIANSFMKKIMNGERIAPTRCISCMHPCQPATTPYCISEALIHAVKGELEQGLIFTGSSAARIHEITTVEKLVHELFDGISGEEE